MSSKNFTYDFFISYRHSDLDSRIAQYLQHALEHYRIPKEIREKTGKQKIRRVFRDNEELSASFDLAGEIREQLNSSEFLIVICSPRTKNSQWVMKEIRTFIELRGREYILPVLIEGEPVDSFPDILLETEPLAADFRAETTRSIIKRCQKEMLRLIAPALHCSYDELKQRHKTYRMRKLASITAVFSAIFLVFSIYSFWQTAQIKDNYEQKQLNQSRYLAQESQDLLDSGDREAALPGPEESNDKPLVADAQLALENALYLYQLENVSDYYPQRKLELNDTFTSIYDVDPENDLLACCDQQGTTYFWDLEDYTLYGVLSHLEEMGDIDHIYLGENGTAYLSDSNMILAYDYVNERIIWQWSTDYENAYGQACDISPDKSMLAFCLHNRNFNDETFGDKEEIITVFLDTESGEVINTMTICPENEDISLTWTVDEIKWQFEGSGLAISVRDNSGSSLLQGHNVIYFLNPETDSVKSLFQWDGAPCYAMFFSDKNTLIFLYNAGIDLSFNIMYKTAPYTVVAVNCTTNDIIWEIENSAIARDGYYAIGGFTSHPPNDPNDITTTIWVKADTEILHIQDGKIVGEFSYSGKVVGVGLGHYGAIHVTEDGILHQAFLNSGTIINEDYGNSDTGIDDIGAVEWTDSDKMVIFPNNGESIYIYTSAGDPDAQFIKSSQNTTSDYFGSPTFCPSGDYYIALSKSDDLDADGLPYYYVNIWDTFTDEIIWSYRVSLPSSTSTSFGFLGNEYGYYASDNQIVFYSIESRQITAEYRDDHSYSVNNPQPALQNGIPCMYYIGADGIMMLSAKHPQPLLILSKEQIQNMTGCVAENEGATLATYEYSYTVFSGGNHLAIWLREGSGKNSRRSSPILLYDLEEQRTLDIPSLSVWADTDYENCVFSDDSTLVLIYGTDQQVHIIDLLQETKIESIHLEGDSYRAFWFSPDNRYVFLHSRSHLLSVYDRNTQIYTMNSESVDYEISNWKFSPDGSELYLTTEYYMSYPVCYTLKRSDRGVYECCSIISNFADISDNCVLEISDTGLYKFPRRSLDEMLAMADELLDTRQLTELEKHRYFVED